MTIRVIHPGQYATVQDVGRRGFSAIGVSGCGAADGLSLRVGNRLVGNPDETAAIEMTLVGGWFEFDDDTSVSITGASASCSLTTVGGRIHEFLPWRAVSVRGGERVRVGAIRDGARCYLCVAGGIETPPELGSRSTFATAGLGGHLGRALRAEDVLAAGPGGRSPGIAALDAAGVAEMRRMLRPSEIPCTQGAHATRFGTAMLNRLADQSFTVDTKWDRVGLRLSGERIASVGGGRVPTEGAIFGAVQVPGDGSPIILGPDAPPTGGYPVIANVVSAALPAIGQLRSGDGIRLQLIDVMDARARLIAQRREVNDLVPPLGTLHRGPIDLNCDLGEDPARVADGDDDRLAELVTSLNIACGGHAGDDRTMAHLVATAVRLGRGVGAHPGYPDRDRFGRVELAMSETELEQEVERQVSRLARIAHEAGATLGHVKLHGALYHAAGERDSLAWAVGRAVTRAAPGAVMVGQSGSAGLAVWREMGFKTAAEGFADRRYTAAGRLLDRRAGGALLENPSHAAEQAVMIARERRVLISEGRSVGVDAQTLCVHGDTPGAIEIARTVRTALEHAGIQLAPMNQ